MIRRFEVDIPKAQWPHFGVFLDTPLPVLNNLVAYVLAAEPTQDVEDLAEQCADSIGADADEVESVLTVCINLSSLHRNIAKPLPGLLEDVAEDLEESGFPEWEEKYSALWHERLPILVSLLVQDGIIELMSKARELLYDFQSLLLDATVLTDVRQVYDREATRVCGGIILHTLSLEYLEDRRPRQLHLQMSSDDVDKLIKRMQRALKKAETSAAALAENGTPNLTPKRS